MKTLRWILAIGALAVSTACASGTTSFTEVASRDAYLAGTPDLFGSKVGSSVRQCTPIDDTSTQISLATTSNQPGVSAAIPLTNFVYLGNADCQAVKDGNGVPVILTQQILQSADIRAQMIAGGFGIVQAAGNGSIASAIVANANKCKGNNCGGGPNVVVQSLIDVNSRSGVDINGALGNPCGSGGCPVMATGD